jgi:hypothetical protein
MSSPVQGSAWRALERSRILSREAEILLRCARSSPNPEEADRLRALVETGLDWPRVIREAERHGLRPLVATHLRAAVGEGAARGGLVELELAALGTARRNVALTAELFRLLEGFDQAGVRVLPYKGPVLAGAVYGSVALREFLDLDLLVRRGDVRAAAHVLQIAGYRAKLPLTPAQEAAVLGSRHELVFVREDGRVVVELQWRVVPAYFAFELDHERLWDRAEWVQLAGRKVPTLRPEDLLLALCVHGTKHLWDRLVWILDVAELIRARTDLDWAEVVTMARHLGALRMLGLGLRLATDLPGASIPPPARDLLIDPVVDRLAIQTWERTLSSSRAPGGIARAAHYHLGARERYRDRMRYCARLALATTPGDWAAIRLPDALFPLYSLVRLARVALKYGMTVDASRAKRGHGS